MVGEELSEQGVKILFQKSGSLTSRFLKNVLKGALVTLPKAALHSHGKTVVKQRISNNTNQEFTTDGNGTTEKSTGAVDIRILENQRNVTLSSIAVDTNEIAGFNAYAVQYGLEYSLVRSIHDPNQYTLFFRNQDIAKFEAAAQDFIADKDLEKEGFAEKFQRAKTEAHRRNMERAKERAKEYGKERAPKAKPPKAQEKSL